MKVEICLEAPMTKSSETMFVGTTNIGMSDEKIELKYNSETKRGYILVNNRWRWGQATDETCGCRIHLH